MFGDHQPKLEDSFYELLYGKSLNSLSLKELQKKYTVPFIIWANYDIDAKSDVENVSANHFSAMFSQKMGQTFIEYLTSLRMHRAKELLRCTDKRSGEIALEVGYKDSHYFSFLFKKTQGCTPSEYRNQGAV